MADLMRLLGLTVDRPHEWAEADAPWVTWTLPYTDRMTRLAGRSTAVMTCCVCGARERVSVRIPRWGPVPVPPGGRHQARLDAIVRHAHPHQRNPSDWALPLRNIQPGTDVLGIIGRVVDTAHLEQEERDNG